MKRLFIAINLPDEIKNRIEKLVSDFKISVNRRSHQRESAAEMRFLPRENWHLTLVFLGYQPDEIINPILNSLKETVKNLPPPAIEFENIIYGPPNKPSRMIWLCGTKETSKKLDEIKKYLENELTENGVKFQRENRPYNTHLTLARFQPAQINADTISTNQFLNQHKSAFIFQANSLDLMEAHLKRTGAEYEILAKMDFIK